MLKHRILWPLFVALGMLTLLLWLILHYAVFWFLLAVIVGIGITAWGAFDIRLGYFTDTFYRRKHQRGKTIALTFDDGPTPFTAQILDLLRQYEAKATFFCIGRQVAQYPELAQRIVQEGHTIANHTYNHSTFFGFQSEAKVLEELQQGDGIIKKIVGKKPKFFRPPFGITNPSVAKAVKQTKHQLIGWSNRSLDTVTFAEEKIYDRVLRKLQTGDIVLFHDTSSRTVHVISRLLPYLKEQGYDLVSVDDLLTLHAYDV